MTLKEQVDKLLREYWWEGGTTYMHREIRNIIKKYFLTEGIRNGDDTLNQELAEKLITDIHNVQHKVY